MISTRESGTFDATLTSERAILREHIESGTPIETDVRVIGPCEFTNPAPEWQVGAYRARDRRKLLTADLEVINALVLDGRPLPSFLEAGPRRELYYDPRRIRAAIVTTGGLAPGLNSIVHSIVKRHYHTYELNPSLGAAVLGIYDSFVGLARDQMDLVPLNPDQTEDWLEKGGSELGNRRTKKGDQAVAKEFAGRLANKIGFNKIDILYVIGGDGSQTIAHEIAYANPKLTVVGLPKTMDNDLMWVWQSFGFNTAVERATEVLNVMNCEARSTRRVCIVELFGAESGFVAANAALASGHSDLVLIPETFKNLTTVECHKLLDGDLSHIARVVNRDHRRPHGLIVVAEGVGKVLAAKGVSVDGRLIDAKTDFLEVLQNQLASRLFDTTGEPVPTFVNRPLHNIRAGKANSHDQIYCERLGALAVDNALAGYTDFLVSQWLTEYVLVPLALVASRRKSIPPDGIFWKQVCSMTGQLASVA
jgi:6-phosphofructokinase 1